MVKILLLLLISGAIVLFQHPTKRTPGDTEVFMTSTGFSSHKIELTAGSRLIFTNRDKTDHWPASNFHPDHSIYPQFDSKKAVKPGESWSFVPKRVGVFRFHDHLYHFSKGVLIISGKANEGKQNRLTIFSSKRNANVSQARFRKLSERQKYIAIGAIIRLHGAVAAWKFISDTYDTYLDTVLEQHNLAHFIGGKLFEELGMKGIAHCTPLFIYGCYHGVLERALVDSINPIADAIKACEDAGRTNGVTYTSCLHGIGHGIATYVDPPSVAKALSLCDLMPKYQPSCHSGVFMEYATGSPTSTFAVDEMTKQNPFSYCMRLGKKYRLACVGRMTNLMEKIYGKPLDSIALDCIKDENKSLRPECLEIVGMTVGERSRGNAETVHTRCNQIPDIPAAAHCVSSAVEKIMFEKYPGWEEAPSLCTRLPVQFQPSCSSRLTHPTEAYQ